MDGNNILLNAAKAAMKERASMDVTSLWSSDSSSTFVNKERIIRIIAKVYSATCQRFIIGDPIHAEQMVWKLLKDSNVQNIVRRSNTIPLTAMHTLEEALKWTAMYVTYGKKLLIAPCIVLEDSGLNIIGKDSSKIPDMWNSFVNVDMDYFDETVVIGTKVVKVGNSPWEVRLSNKE